MVRQFSGTARSSEQDRPTIAPAVAVAKQLALFGEVLPSEESEDATQEMAEEEEPLLEQERAA